MDDDDIKAQADRLLASGWAKPSAPPAPPSDVYLVHWRKDEWIISRNGLKEWSGYDPAALAQQKRMIEARGGKIEAVAPTAAQISQRDADRGQS